jgi:taurine--2-oxoglutarate transaminase
MCGFGRTGKWFGYQHFDVKPDIVVAAKGIVSAQLPVAAVIVGKNISDFFDQYRWQHYVTFGGHPLCLAAAVANLKVMMEEKILDNVEKMGKYLKDKLKGVEERHKSVGYVNGMGLFWGMELVKNKKTKEPFVKSDRFARYTGDISNYPVNIIQSRCLEKKVLYSGFVPNTLRIAPPLNTNEKDLDIAIEALEYGLTFLDERCDKS